MTEISRGLLDPNVYYSSEGNDTLTSNSLEELMAKSNRERELDKKAIDLYLTLRYVPAPYTMYRNIKRLPAGYHLDNNKSEIKKGEADSSNQHDFDTYVEKARGILLNTVQKELQGESEVALLLSGGIDSSIILAALSKFDVGIKTYTLGFSQDDADLLQARKIAQFYSTNHKEIILKDFPEETFRKIMSNMEILNGDPTMIPTKILIENVEGVNKIFVGEGGDEVFGGYPEFRFVELGKYLSAFPTFFLSIAAGFMKSEIKERGGSFFKYYNTHPAQSFLYFKSVFTPEEKEKLYVNNFKDGFEIEDGSIFAFVSDLNYLQNVVRFYLENQLPGRLVPKYCTNTFKVCFPFLDERMIDLMLSAPAKCKFGLIRAREKKVLRKIMAPELPSFIVSQGKRGFIVPVEKWLKGKLGEEVRKTLNKTKIENEGRFNWDFVEPVLENYDKSFYWRNKIWSLFVLEKWLDVHCGEKQCSR